MCHSGFKQKPIMIFKKENGFTSLILQEKTSLNIFPFVIMHDPIVIH